MALDRLPRRLCPDCRVAAVEGGIAAGQGISTRRHGGRARCQHFEVLSRRRHRRGRRPKRGCKRGQSRVQSRHQLAISPRCVRQPAPGRLQQGNAVGNTRELRRAGGPVGRCFRAGIRHRDQVGGQIAAVDRRHVFRRQRAEILGVVPVVEMAAESLQRGHRRDGSLQPLEHVEGSDPAEVPGGDGRQQVEPDVGRRGPMGNHWPRVFLEVIRRQHVVGGRHERLKVAPRPTRDQPQLMAITRPDGQLCRASGRPTDPAGEERGQQPRRHKRQG